MSIICANVKISGTRPLLFNRFTEEAIPITKQEKWGVPGNNPQEWKKLFKQHHKDNFIWIPFIFSLVYAQEENLYPKEEEL